MHTETTVANGAGRTRGLAEETNRPSAAAGGRSSEDALFSHHSDVETTLEILLGFYSKQVVTSWLRSHSEAKHAA